MFIGWVSHFALGVTVTLISIFRKEAVGKYVLKDLNRQRDKVLPKRQNIESH